MINKVFDYIEKYHMILPHDIVVAGISGGADSVCLLRVLKEVQTRIPFTIHVVHINHMIRKEAGEDEEFVRRLCNEADIPFHAIHADVEAIAEKKHITTEEAGREVRYAAFYELLKKYEKNGNGKIAIAHNKNDSAETVLFHMFRGSGMKGLTGILPVREKIIRPLLCVERREIEDYLQKINQPFCIDATNLTDEYARNRIRHHVLQFATDHICSASVSHIQDAADKIQQINEFIERMSLKAYDECVKNIDNDTVFVNKDMLDRQDTVLHNYVIIEAIHRLIHTKKDIAAVHIEDIVSLFLKQPGKRIDLPYNLEARREYDGIVICRRKIQKAIQNSKEHQYIDILNAEEGKTYSVKMADGNVLEYSVFTNDGSKIIPQKTYTKWLDYDKIKGRLSIRNRMTGDYLTVNDTNQKQTLKSYFINEKVEREKRDEIYLLTEDNHVLWIIGYRISNYYKVGKDTKRILKVNLRGGSKDG